MEIIPFTMFTQNDDNVAHNGYFYTNKDDFKFFVACKWNLGDTHICLYLGFRKTDVQEVEFKQEVIKIKISKDYTMTFQTNLYFPQHKAAILNFLSLVGDSTKLKLFKERFSVDKPRNIDYRFDDNDRFFINYVYLCFYKRFLDVYNVDRDKCKKIIKKKGNFLKFFMDLTGADMKFVQACADQFCGAHMCKSCGTFRKFVNCKETVILLTLLTNPIFL